MVGVTGWATAAPTGRITLAGSAPAYAVSTKSAGSAAPGTGSVSVRVYLVPRGGQAGLNAAVAAVSTPGTAGYRHFITPGQYQDRYAPTSAAVASVRDWLAASGLQVTGVASGNRYVEAIGHVAGAQRAFGVTIRQYRQGGTVKQGAVE